MNQAPVGIEQVRALVEAFRAIDARSVHVVSLPDGSLSVTVDVAGDGRVAEIAAAIGLPAPIETRYESARCPGVEHRWLSAWGGRVDGNLIEISGPHTQYPSASATISAPAEVAS